MYLKSLIRILSVGIAGLLPLSTAFGQDQKTPEMKTLMDSTSYAIGMNIANSLKADSVQLNAELLAAGFSDAMNDQAALSDADAQTVMLAFQQHMMQLTQERMMRVGEENKRRGEAFLADNKKKTGVQVTPSGLQYVVKVKGSGESPGTADNVKVEYRGTLIDGTEFDKSQPGNPVSFPVSGVIPGFSEALQMMKPGAEWTIYIPGNLAYGPQGGPGGKIGPNETLIFDVKLVEIESE